MVKFDPALASKSSRKRKRDKERDVPPIFKKTASARSAAKRSTSTKVANKQSAFATATAAVFNTVELLETILGHLDIVSLLHNQRVCKHFRATIADSPTLQQALFFRSSPTSALTFNPLLVGRTMSFGCSLSPGGAGHVRIFESCDYSTKPPQRTIHVEYHLRVSMMVLHSLAYWIGNRTTGLRRHRDLEGSWQQMHIGSIAPRSNFKVMLIKWKYHGQPAVQVCRRDLETMGDVMDAILEMERSTMSDNEIIELETDLQYRKFLRPVMTLYWGEQQVRSLRSLLELRFRRPASS